MCFTSGPILTVMIIIVHYVLHFLFTITYVLDCIQCVIYFSWREITLICNQHSDKLLLLWIQNEFHIPTKTTIKVHLPIIKLNIKEIILIGYDQPGKWHSPLLSRHFPTTLSKSSNGYLFSSTTMWCSSS